MEDLIKGGGLGSSLGEIKSVSKAGSDPAPAPVEPTPVDAPKDKKEEAPVDAPEDKKESKLEDADPKVEDTIDKVEDKPEDKTEDSPKDAALEDAPPASEEPVAEFGQTDFENYLFDQTDGRFNSLDDITQAIETADSASAAPIEAKSPLLKQMLELEAQGVDVTLEKMNQLSVDYKSLDHTDLNVAKQLVAAKIKDENPGISDKHLNILMKEYEIDRESMDDDDADRVEVKLTLEAAKAKAYMEDQKSKLSVPTLESPEQQQAALADQKKQRDALNKEIRLATTGLKEITVDIGEGETFTYQLSKDDQRSIHKAGLETESFFGQFFGEDGSLKGQELAEFLSWRNLKDKMIPALVAQARTNGKEKFVSEDLKNSSAPGQPVSQKSEPKGDWQTTVANAFIARQNSR